MKAFLLAGGLGTRLFPLTRAIPKCMVSIGETPLLAIWFDHLTQNGITEVLVNVSQHVQVVERFLASRTWDLTVHLEVEHEPRGNAGTIAARRDFVAGEERFFVLYSDNLTDVSLQPLVDLHARHDDPITIGLFRAPVPQAAGIVELSEAGRVLAFEEKPRAPKSNLANAGLYLARPSIFDAIPTSPSVIDFGHDVFPRLTGRMYGCALDGFFMDIGTPESLRAAAALWEQRREVGAGA